MSEQENVLSSPMAVGTLLWLKEECERQHARAEKAEATVARQEGEIARLREALKEMTAGCAAGMRVLDDHGLADAFVLEARAAGVTDGFGVRANKILASLPDGATPREE